MQAGLRDLVRPCPPVGADLSCAEAFEVFEADDDLLVLPVVEGDRPVGLLNRHEFLAQPAQLYGRALYDKRPVSAAMDADPLIIEVDADMERLNRAIVTEKPNALLKGFIVTENGRYLGVGTAMSLLQSTILMMRERAGDVERARREAQRANRTMSEFLANMSHELRTPLNAIIGFSEVLMLETLGPLDNPRYREYVQDINSSGTHLLSIINDVLDVSKIEAGKMDLHEQELVVERSIQRALRLVAEQAQQRNITLGARVPDDLPGLRADDLKLQQVLLNLLSNAVKFTPDGGHVEVSASADAEAGLTIAVADNGIGISETDLPRVILPFQQVESGLSRNYEGTGLGLPLVKSLTELHGGRFEMESRLGQGTTVRVLLPAERLIYHDDPDSAPVELEQRRSA